MVTRDGRRSITASAVTTAALSDPNIRNLVSSLVRMAGRGMANAGRSSTQPKAQRSVASRKARQTRSDNDTSAGPSSKSIRGGKPALYKSVGSTNSVRLVLKDFQAISNQATAGQCFLGYSLSYATDTSNATLGTIMTRFSSMGNLYRSFYINSIGVTFVPYVSTSNGGNIGIGFDPDPEAGTPSSLGQVVRHRVSRMGDIQQQFTLVYSPRIDRRTEPLYTLNSATRDETALSFGVLQIASYNTVGASPSGNIGSLLLELDVTLVGPL